MKQPVFLVPLCAQRDANGILPLVFEGLAYALRVGIGGITQQSQLLICSIRGAEHAAKFIRRDVEEAQLAKLGPEAVGCFGVAEQKFLELLGCEDARQVAPSLL